VRGAVAVVVLALAIAGCGTDREDVQIMEATIWGDTSALGLVVESCNGEPEVEVVRQGDREVRLRVRADDSDDDCADGAPLCLDAPLGDRTVIDDLTGDAVAVTRHRADAPGAHDCA
jgi:hypothetical protein